MTGMWRREYKKLTEFISSHPEIVITEDRVSTPEVSRADFYSLFNATLAAFVEEYYAGLIEDSETLVKAYAAAVPEAIDQAGIESVSAPADFDKFLSNPKATLARPVFQLGTP